MSSEGYSTKQQYRQLLTTAHNKNSCERSGRRKSDKLEIADTTGDASSLYFLPLVYSYHYTEKEEKEKP